MKLCVVVSIMLAMVGNSAKGFERERHGFYLPENQDEVILNFKTQDNLIVLPVIFNDSIKLNLIVDSGCRNIVLFGKQFEKMFNIVSKRPARFSGLGQGEDLSGYISLDNKVNIDPVFGERIALVIVPHKNLFSKFSNIHGVIGYDLFSKFEIEINSRAKKITFRSPYTTYRKNNFHLTPITTTSAHPVLQAQVKLSENKNKSLSILIDTGSGLGMLIKSNELMNNTKSAHKTLGLGLNGPVNGIEFIAEEVDLSSFKLQHVPSGITNSVVTCASLGMGIFKDHTILFNYVQGYFGIEKS